MLVESSLEDIFSSVFLIGEDVEKDSLWFLFGFLLLKFEGFVF